MTKKHTPITKQHKCEKDGRGKQHKPVTKQHKCEYIEPSKHYDVYVFGCAFMNLCHHSVATFLVAKNAVSGTYAA